MISVPCFWLDLLGRISNASVDGHLRLSHVSFRVSCCSRVIEDRLTTCGTSTTTYQGTCRATYAPKILQALWIGI